MILLAVIISKHDPRVRASGGRGQHSVAPRPNNFPYGPYGHIYKTVLTETLRLRSLHNFLNNFPYGRRWTWPTLHHSAPGWTHVINIYIYIYIKLYISTSLSLYLSIYLSIYPSFSLSLYLSMYLSIHISLSLCTHIYIYVRIHVYIYIYIHT